LEEQGNLTWEGERGSRGWEDECGRGGGGDSREVPPCGGEKKKGSHKSRTVPEGKVKEKV